MKQIFLLITILISLFLSSSVFAATVTKTIGTNSRDYSTITLWEADLDDAGIYASGDIAVGEVYNDSAFDESVTIDGGAAIGLASVTLTVAEGDRHDGTAGTGARNIRNAATKVFEVTSARPVTIEWLEIKNESRYILVEFNDYVGLVGTLQRCILWGLRRAGSGAALQGVVANAKDGRIQNNIIYDFLDSSGSDNVYGIRSSHSSTGRVAKINNNTVYLIQHNGTGNVYGVRMDYDKTGEQVQNNISVDTGGSTSGEKADYSFAGTSNIVSNNNLSSDDTADDGGGSEHLVSKSSADQFVSTVDGSEDLHLKSGADAINAGTDLEITPTGVNIDINGRDRHAEGDVWDIGAHEFVAAVVDAIIKIKEGIKFKGGMRIK